MTTYEYLTQVEAYLYDNYGLALQDLDITSEYCKEHMAIVSAQQLVEDLANKYGLTHISNMSLNKATTFLNRFK